jgi:type II secretory pathway pseudopilin PulG
MRIGRTGSTLLESIVALAVLAGTGTSLVAALAASIRSEHQLHRRESTVRAAHRVLTAMSLLTREELEQRIGRQPIGEFVAAVERTEPTLFRISVAEARAPEIETLVTVVYRPAAASP